MALTHATAVRNAIADAVVDLIDAAGSGGELIIKDGGVVLATFVLPSPSFGDAAAGVALANAIDEVDATATGEADAFELTDAAGTVIISGTVTVVGDGGDVELSDVDLVAGDPVSVDLLNYTAPV